MKRVWLIVGWGALSGCVATERSVTDLQRSVDSLTQSTQDLRANQAEFITQMDRLNTSLNTLNAKLEESKGRMSALAQKLDDVESGLTRRLDSLAHHLSGAPLPAQPTPSQLFQIAYGDYTKGQYDVAMVGFRSYLEKYPQGELAPQARFYLAECFRNKKALSEALGELDKIVSLYPTSAVRPKALFKKAVILKEQKNTDAAVKVLQELLQMYPQGEEAPPAQELLKELTAASGSPPSSSTSPPAAPSQP
ncbi:MAG: tetratricopeptide repeat protein [Elusimicrobia bacterium]|nr:tetratricopeptide repeat protein [Elusimicrobiota bacterium]